MQKRLLFDNRLLQVTISRLCQQIIETHGDFSNTVFIGLQPRGVHFAKRLVKRLETLLGVGLPLGYLDTTFHRDDFRRRNSPLSPSITNIPFIIENKQVILIDDVLYTGRSVRAALDAMNAFGRPKNVELLVLIDRLYARHIPIQATYVGRPVNTIDSQKVDVEWADIEDDNQVWLVNQEG